MKALFALIYDTLLSCAILFVGMLVALLIATGFHHTAAFGPEESYVWVYLWAFLGLYFTYAWHKGGQTLGLLAWKLKIMDANHKPLSYPKAWLRYGLATLSLLCFGLGFFFRYVNKEKKYWHDWVLGSVVSASPSRP